MVRFGFSHTIMVDNDSKFLAKFTKAATLLKINIHVLSGENHNPMIVENRAALEGILMALYGRNSAPAIDTDISRSFLVTVRDFQFPIDFSTEQHQLLTSTPLKVESFAADKARLLSYGRELAKHLIQAHRAWHRE